MTSPLLGSRITVHPGDLEPGDLFTVGECVLTIKSVTDTTHPPFWPVLRFEESRMSMNLDPDLMVTVCRPRVPDDVLVEKIVRAMEMHANLYLRELAQMIIATVREDIDTTNGAET